MVKKIITLLLFCTSQTCFARGTWTLRECIEYGLANHRNIAIYANEKVAADAKANEALADYLPRITLNTTLDNNLKLQQNVIPAGIFGPDEVRVSLTQKFNSNAVAQLDQVVYDKSLLTAFKANKYNKQQSDLNLLQSQDAIIYNICTAYFQIMVYNQQFELLQYNRQTYEKQLEIYGLQVAKGIALQKDLDKVSVDYNNTISQIRVAGSNIELAENELKYEMGYAMNEQLIVDVLPKLQIPLSLPDSSEQFSPISRIDYKLKELDIKLLQVDQSRIRAEAYPKLSAYFRYGAVGFGDNLNGAYDELLPYSTVGLKLSIPILDFYKRNARYKQAEIRRINAEESLRLDEGKYTMQYNNARTKLLRAEANVENDKRNIKLAESVLQVTDLQFQKGTTNLTDWLNTQNALKDAQNSFINSIYTYYQARIDLEKASGSLKSFYKSL